MSLLPSRPAHHRFAGKYILTQKIRVPLRAPQAEAQRATPRNKPARSRTFPLSPHPRRHRLILTGNSPPLGTPPLPLLPRY
jgi:hypothetical protein